MRAKEIMAQQVIDELLHGNPETKLKHPKTNPENPKTLDYVRNQIYEEVDKKQREEEEHQEKLGGERQ